MPLFGHEATPGLCFLALRSGHRSELLLSVSAVDPLFQQSLQGLQLTRVLTWRAGVSKL
jgi:hypothetical protein